MIYFANTIVSLLLKLKGKMLVEDTALLLLLKIISVRVHPSVVTLVGCFISCFISQFFTVNTFSSSVFMCLLQVEM